MAILLFYQIFKHFTIIGYEKYIIFFYNYTEYN